MSNNKELTEAFHNINSPETLEEVEAAVKSDIDLNSVPHLNREQRRFLAKKAGKRGRASMDTISETAKKLTYIKLIEELRKLNEEKENGNEEANEDG